MNWKLKFVKDKVFVQILKDKKVIYTRAFLGWQTRGWEDTILLPKFELKSNERIEVDEDNVYII